LADALGRPLAFHLTGGEAADRKTYDALIVLPERAPDALLADKGYDADAIRADLAKRQIKPVIPGRSNRRVKIEHDRLLYKQHNRIEHVRPPQDQPRHCHPIRPTSQQLPRHGPSCHGKILAKICPRRLSDVF